MDHSSSHSLAVVPVEPGVLQIDHRFRGSPGVIASYLLADGPELTLIETGPASTLDTLLAGVRAAGHDPAAISRILVTHIHLDHAGAAGALLRMLPEARLYVHPLGAPHLVDPSRLLASAERIYGALMKPLWGDVLPVPADRIVALEDGAVVTVPGRRLLAIHTPGHAVHHVAFHDPDAGSVYAGDVVGVRLEGAPYVRPPTPPPDLDLDAWRTSILRLRAAAPRRLYLTHFGGVDDVAWHLDELLARLFFWAGRIGTQIESGLDREAITAALRASEAAALAAAGDAALARRYEEAGNYEMSVDGFFRYYRKRGEARRPTAG